MLKHLPLKIFALVLATIFWIFVVSFENTFYQFPEDVKIQIFNLAPELAVTEDLGAVKLGIRASDSVVYRTLTAADFEAYVDLRNAGAGQRKVAVSVTSKNPQVTVVRVFPNEVSLNLEPVRQKNVSVTSEVLGKPAKGYKVGTVKLSKNTVAVSGAETFLKKIAQARGQINLSGTETRSMTKKVEVVFYDEAGLVLEGIKIDDSVSLEADMEIIEVEGNKEVGIKAKLEGAMANGVVKKVEVSPAVISINGRTEALTGILFVETEKIDLKDIEASFSKKVKIILPKDITLAAGQSGEVTVKVEIEKQQ